MIIVIKAFTLAIFFGWVWAVCQMIRLGRRADSLANLHPTRHELYAPTVYWMTAAMITTAALCHVLIRHQIGGASGWLFAFHLIAATTFLIALVLMRRNPGTVRPGIHRRVARQLLIPSFIGVVLSGPILVIMM